MATTTNYGLNKADSSSDKYLSWRDGIDENMDTIDTALKAATSVSFTATLAAESGWSGSEAPYTQEIVVPDGYTVTEDTNGTVSVANTATYDQRNMAREAQLCVTGQSDGSITISADGELPDVDIPVTIILIG